MAKYCDIKAFWKLRTEIENAMKEQKEAASDAHEMVFDALLACLRYVADVCEYEFQTSTLHIISDTLARQALLQESENTRHRAHEAAIINVRVLNRLCDCYKVDHVFLGNENERVEIAEFCLELTNAIFSSRKL